MNEKERMNQKTKDRLAIREQLVLQISQMGHPREFGELIADSLGTEKTMRRLSMNLTKTGYQPAEQIADEMLAIVSDRDRWVEKKKNEYYNRKYNQMRYTVLGSDDEG